ncbi:MAG: hypothetical protein NUV84_02970, partial [Candidatus Uhrbacteria bacterium]|nr:hypothetical protein [Candidatus Uhrbacteria bacterium]
FVNRVLTKTWELCDECNAVRAEACLRLRMADTKGAAAIRKRYDAALDRPLLYPAWDRVECGSPTNHVIVRMLHYLEHNDYTPRPADVLEIYGIKQDSLRVILEARGLYGKYIEVQKTTSLHIDWNNHNKTKGIPENSTGLFRWPKRRKKA